MDATATFELDQPMQLKGEIIDFEFTLGGDVDHRKRRRNRTTQSCLNCHTSKRKCDRKRPCSRCIQLGLTGLCVYEIDDPALRDDPNVDEPTRLRNRIAELESLVRELRGKPHPKWADSSFCESDPSEKWHSRASKRSPTLPSNTVLSPHSHSHPSQSHNSLDHSDNLPLTKRRRSFQDDLVGVDSSSGTSPTSIGTPIQSDPGQGGGGGGAQYPYRFTPSPDSNANVNGSPYQGYTNPSGGGGYGADHQLSYSPAEPSSSSSFTFPPQQQSHLHQQQQFDHSGNGGGYRPTTREEYEYCPCLTNPAANQSFIMLAQQVQSALSLLRSLPEHRAGGAGGGGGEMGMQCLIMRRIGDVHELLHGSSPYSPNPNQNPNSATRDSSSLSPYESTHPRPHPSHPSHPSHHQQHPSQRHHLSHPHHSSSTDSLPHHTQLPSSGMADDVESVLSAFSGGSSGHRSPLGQMPPQMGNGHHYGVNGLNGVGGNGNGINGSGVNGSGVRVNGNGVNGNGNGGGYGAQQQQQQQNPYFPPLRHSHSNVVGMHGHGQGQGGPGQAGDDFGLI